MKKIIFLIASTFQVFCLFAQNQNDSLLNVLDNTITERPQFARIKELHIDSIKLLLAKSQSSEQSYTFSNQLFQEYKHYNLDSALLVANRKNNIAAKLDNLQYQYESRMNIAEILGKMGMYKETFEIIDLIKRADLDKNLQGYYFHLYHSIYSLLYENALSQQTKEYYRDLIQRYKDSSLQVNDPATLGYKLLLNGKLIEQRRYNEALALMNLCYKDFAHTDAEIGNIAYEFSSVYEKLGAKEQQEKYLAIAAISDIRGAAKSYIALRKLAVLLYQKGDLERAYSYITCSIEDATFCKARFRMIEISETLPIIAASYDKKMKEEKDRLFKHLVLISVLSVVLLICIFFIYKQLQKISAARQLVKNANDELTLINETLKDLNKKLSESNQVKETYIGYVFNLCSSYINKLENYRLNLDNKLRTKKIDEALNITGSTSLVTNELKEFFQNFDVIFLNLYPNFIDEFNAMLKKDEQIIPKSGDVLTPELRIYALTRLGISSSKIAEFLHYSPQTVYNYKLKIKNKLEVSKDEFGFRIQQIGK